jgi:molecular chaperone GrpE (heat shock protein)
MTDAIQTILSKRPWFKSWVSNTFNIHADDFVQIQEELVKTNRQLRRLQLAQDNLAEISGIINQRLLAADQRMMASTANITVQKKVYPFAILDELEKLEKLTAVAGGATSSITDNIKKLILGQWKLEAIECVGAPYSLDRSEVSVAITNNEYAPGTVLEIVRQGYTCDDQCIRKALVIVAK